MQIIIIASTVHRKEIINKDVEDFIMRAKPQGRTNPAGVKSAIAHMLYLPLRTRPYSYPYHS